MTRTHNRFLTLAAFILTGWQAPALCADDKSFAKWEYRVVTKDQVLELGKSDLSAGLNQLGSEGWELVVVDGGYIFKRQRIQSGKDIAELRLTLNILQSDVEMQKERLAWSERMLKMGYLSGQAVGAERERLRRLELLLEKTQKELDPLGPAPKEPIELAPPPKERMPEK